MCRSCYAGLLVVGVLLSGIDRGIADDGLRKVDARRYGIQVRVPQAWTLIDWETHEKAFVLRLPRL